MYTRFTRTKAILNGLATNQNTRIQLKVPHKQNINYIIQSSIKYCILIVKHTGQHDDI